MKGVLQFLRTTLVGGILFLVPIIVVVAIIGKALGIANQIVAPLAAHIPMESVIGLDTPKLLAITLLAVRFRVFYDRGPDQARGHPARCGAEMSEALWAWFERAAGQPVVSCQSIASRTGRDWRTPEKDIMKIGLVT